VSATAISAVAVRRPTTLSGWVTGVEAYARPWVRLDIDFCDGTGTITLRFMGRTHIPGIVVGSHMTVEGTPGVEGGTLVMLNPVYAFVVEDGNSTGACEDPRC
jgi:hypothetical protein